MPDLFSNAAAAASKSLVEKILSPLTKAASDEYHKLEFDLMKGIPQYLDYYLERCNQIRTLVKRNEPAPLLKHFIKPRFIMNKEEFSTENYYDYSIKVNNKTLITGRAGSGKSVFAKYSLIQAVESGASFFPVFIELRGLNEVLQNDDFFTDFVFGSIHKHAETFKKVQFTYGLKHGIFTLILDGFDEVRVDARVAVSAKIQDFCERYPDCSVLVTSRPMDIFQSWEEFTTFEIQSFNLNECTDFIWRIDYDHEIKQEFLKELKVLLFEEHKDFLSNPLLATMMLLTYSQFSRIPEKKHIFYEKSFQVLIREHDATKGKFYRELHSKLSEDEIEKLFMMFCTVSYLDGEFDFSEKRIRAYIQDALDLCDFQNSVDDCLADFCHSLSLILKEGDMYFFAHRSFQEYFFSRYAINIRGKDLRDLLEATLSRYSSDDVFLMMRDMNREVFDFEYLLPRTREIYEEIKKLSPKISPHKIIGTLYYSITLLRDNIRSTENVPNLVILGGDHSNWSVLDIGVRIFELERPYVDEVRTNRALAKFLDENLTITEIEKLKRSDAINLNLELPAAQIKNQIKDVIMRLEEGKEGMTKRKSDILFKIGKRSRSAG
ncbi:MAG: NACHT domain-containing protein [Pseudomonadota bacterium]